MPKTYLELWTDGSCFPNPGYGGWAWASSTERFNSGGAFNTTSNRMELIAIIQAIEAHAESTPLKIFSDSQYCVQGAMQWRHKWESKNWEGIKNPDLWKKLSDLLSSRTIELQWVRGHAGNLMNEFVDSLANKSALRVNKFKRTVRLLENRSGKSSRKCYFWLYKNKQSENFERELSE